MTTYDTGAVAPAEAAVPVGRVAGAVCAALVGAISGPTDVAGGQVDGAPLVAAVGAVGHGGGADGDDGRGQNGGEDDGGLHCDDWGEEGFVMNLKGRLWFEGRLLKGACFYGEVVVSQASMLGVLAGFYI